MFCVCGFSAQVHAAPLSVIAEYKILVLAGERAPDANVLIRAAAVTALAKTAGSGVDSATTGFAVELDEIRGVAAGNPRVGKTCRT